MTHFDALSCKESKTSVVGAASFKRSCNRRSTSASSAQGLEIALQESHQLWQLNAVRVPEGVDGAAVRKRLLSDFNIEVDAGLGPLKGKIWRVGLMGETSSKTNVRAFLSALGQILNDSGRKIETPVALAAAAT